MTSIPFETNEGASNIVVVEDSRGLVLRLSTDITIRNAAALRDAIVMLWDQKGNPARLLLDVGAVHHVDSSGVGVFMDLSRTAASKGARFILCGPQKSLRRLLERTALLQLFYVSETVNDGLQTRVAGSQPLGDARAIMVEPQDWAAPERTARGIRWRGENDLESRGWWPQPTGPTLLIQ